MTTEERIKQRYDYWKKVGYKLEISEDGANIKFANNEERLPCYIEFKNGYTMCYGDYSSFVFCRDLRKVNLNSVHYIASKCECGKIDEFDYDKLNEDIKKLVDEVAESCEIESHKKEMLDVFVGWSGDYYGQAGELDSYLRNVANSLELLDNYEDCDWSDVAEYIQTFDFKEGWYDTFGIQLSEHFLAQIVILMFVQEELKQ